MLREQINRIDTKSVIVAITMIRAYQIRNAGFRNSGLFLMLGERVVGWLG